ncbi:DUF1232 domain-containing protein [Clostridium sp. YIM B02505]|uniref:DUF1232 domain-containing protein n=1 Tax=Clostridium yunnanense TaxID=2800325 RepID=A0ABS1ERA3_9CLOT|nr:DUF1232 domain-containing protein [Clostridium yunnanense]MBK1811894.1 DUF1232 domain-containing protein [Clostridium yunnanense]
MHVSQVTARLSGQDVMSILNDFVKVDGLSFENIKIWDTIEVEGNFEKIVNIRFKGQVEIISIHNNILTLNISRVKIMKVGILKFIKNFALKLSLKNVKHMGISAEKDIIKININSILKLVPFLNLNVGNLCLKEGFILADIDSATIDLKRIGEAPEVIEEKIEEEAPKEEVVLINVQKVKDGYSDKREKAAEKIPKRLKKYSDYLFIIPDIVALVYRLLKDKRVAKKTKIVLISSMAYITLPFDILPDKIPFVGGIDDLGAVFFAINRIVEDVPIEIILENWQGKNEFIDVLRSSAEYLTRYTAAKNIEKVYSAINQLVEV